jgi:HK97 family phage portal protein
MSLMNLFNLNPAPHDDFWYGLPSNRTVAGVPVDENVAMTYSACWAATMLLSTSGAMLPLKLFRRLPGGGSEPATDDPRYYLVHDAPNNDMTTMMYRSSRIAQQVNAGNCFSEIERNRAGQPVALHPIHASRIPEKNIRRGSDGRLRYYINNNLTEPTELRDSEVLHVPSPISEDGIIGKGVVASARLSIGFGLATEKQGAAYFGNSARPKIVVKGGKFKDNDARSEFRRQWEEIHGGPENNGRPALLPEGADVTVLSFSAEDSQFLETRQHNIEEIARWYGVPPHLIGHLLRSTNNNIEQQSLEFVKYSLMRWLVLWEQELNKKLLTPEERKSLYFKHVVEGLERADITTRTNALQQQFFNGALTLNQWLALEDRNPIGPLGDLHWLQQAMVPLEMAAKGPQEPAPANEPPADEEDEPEDDDNLRAVVSEMALAMLQDVWQRMLSVEINNVKRVAEKTSRFDARLSEFYDKHEGTMQRSLARPFKLAAVASNSKADLSGIISSHIKESKQQLDTLLDCQPEELAGKVDACVATWHERTIELEGL